MVRQIFCFVLWCYNIVISLDQRLLKQEHKSSMKNTMFTIFSSTFMYEPKKKYWRNEKIVLSHWLL